MLEPFEHGGTVGILEHRLGLLVFHLVDVHGISSLIAPALRGDDDVAPIVGDVEAHGIGVDLDAAHDLHVTGVDHIQAAREVAGGKHEVSARRELDGASALSHLATLPSLQRDGLASEALGGLQELVELDALHVARLVDTQVEISVADDEMPHIGHHAHHATQVFLCLHVDDGNTAVVSHTSHEQVLVVGGVDGAPQAVAALVVAVDLLGEAEVERQHVVHHEERLMIPLVGVQAGHVHQSHGVVAPVGDGHVLAIVRAGHHLGQRPRLHEFHDRVVAGVDHGDGRRILGVDVVGAAVEWYPQVSSAMREGALHGFSHKRVQVLRVVGERIELAGLAPQVGVFLVLELVSDDFQPLVGVHVVDHGGAAFQ